MELGLCRVIPGFTSWFLVSNFSSKYSTPVNSRWISWRTSALLENSAPKLPECHPCVCVCFVPVTLDFSGNKLGYHFLWYEEVVEGCSLAQKGRWRLPFLWFWFLWNRICSKGRVHQDRGPWERTQFYFANSPSGLKAKTWDRKDIGKKLHFALILIRIGKHSWKRDFSLLCLIQSPLLSLGISSFNFFFFFFPSFQSETKKQQNKANQSMSSCTRCENFTFSFLSVMWLLVGLLVVRSWFSNRKIR